MSSFFVGVIKSYNRYLPKEQMSAVHHTFAVCKQTHIPKTSTHKPLLLVDLKGHQKARDGSPCQT
jgi:hypothetical protein